MGLRFWLQMCVLFIVLGGLLALCTDAHDAQAADPPLSNQPRPDQFPGIDHLNVGQAELLNAGIYRWRYSKNASCQGDVFPAVIAALDHISRETNVMMLHDPANGWDVYANCGTSFAAVCGSSTGVIGCLGRGFPWNCDIDINTLMAYPVAYPADSQFSIMLHEFMHCLMTWNEQYAPNFAPSPGWRDFMNTGPLSRHGFEYVEQQRWARVADPCYAKNCVRGIGGSGAGLHVFWSNHARGYYAAILAFDVVTGIYRFTGLRVPTNGAPYQGLLLSEIPLGPNERPCVNLENGANIFLGRNDTCL